MAIIVALLRPSKHSNRDEIKPPNFAHIFTADTTEVSSLLGFDVLITPEMAGPKDP